MTLLGHNGAGKSTIIKYLLGFYPSINDHPYLKNLAPHLPKLDQKEIGYAPELALLLDSATAKEYIALKKSIKSIKSLDIDKLLNSVMLTVDLDMPIKKYSKGMKQKLLLALCLIGDPKTIILDEPTSGLDIFVTKEIEKLLVKLNKNYNLIVSTHSLNLARELNSEILIISKGELYYRGRVDEKLEERVLDSFKSSEIL